MASKYIILSALFLSFAVGVAICLMHIRKDRKKALIGLAMSTFVPMAGILMSIILFIRFKRGHYAMDTEETIRKIKIKESEYIDEERMRNTVPSRDALSISNNRERRGYVRGLLRQHEMESLRPILHQAIHNADSESSHYAASAIMELQRLSYNSMTEAACDYESSPGDYETAKRYALLILDYLDNSEIGNLKLVVFRSRCEDVLLHILRDLRDKCGEDDFENLIRLYLRQGRHYEAWDWACAYVEAYPNSETGYFDMLEIAYLRGDSDAFYKTLDKLRSRSDVVLSHERLTTLRFWVQNRMQGREAN